MFFHFVVIVTLCYNVRLVFDKVQCFIFFLITKCDVLFSFLFFLLLLKKNKLLYVSARSCMFYYKT